MSMQVEKALAQLVAAARELGTDQVSLGVCDQTVDLIVGVPGAKTRKTIYREATETYAIETVRIEVDAVEVLAQRRGRLATAEESAALQREDVHEHKVEYRAVTIRDTGAA